MTDTPQYAPIEVYLTVDGGQKAIDWYKAAFGAEVGFQQMTEDGKRLMHATLGVFGAQIMMSDYFPEFEAGVTPPSKVGTATLTIHVNLATPAMVDGTIGKAEKAGGTVIMPATDAPWGMRYGRLKDPFGHVWSFGAALPSKG